jgi:hypothetical protein
MPGILPGMPSENQIPLTQPANRTVDLIVIHCSATPSGKPLQRGVPGQRGYLDCAQIIDAWHAERGFARQIASRDAFNPTLGSIGYHFVIDLDGKVYTGRSIDEVGAHAAGHNAHSIGICMVGGLEPLAQYTPAQWKALQSVVLWQSFQHNIPLAPPLRNGNVVWRGVCGHRDLSPDLNHDSTINPSEWLKTCPGFDVAEWLSYNLHPQDKNISLVQST